jgi:NAD+ diphosphatase
MSTFTTNDIKALHISLFSGLDIVLPSSIESKDSELPVLPACSLELLGQEFSPALFKYDNSMFGAMEVPEDRLQCMSGFTRLPLRQFVGASSPRASSFALKARGYAHWGATYKYCATCASPLFNGQGLDGEGGRACPSCGRVFFPKISPAIIVLVSRGSEVLLAHNVKFPTNRHGLIAGFVEPGETLEETVRREVMEEAGIAIDNLRYVRSQPWPFPDSLMLGFEAEYVGGTLHPDGQEIDHLDWFSKDSLPEIPPPGSIARFLIEKFFATQCLASVTNHVSLT